MGITTSQAQVRRFTDWDNGDTNGSRRHDNDCGRTMEFIISRNGQHSKSHQRFTMTARTAVTAGDTIAIKSAVAADLATLAASVAGGTSMQRQSQQVQNYRVQDQGQIRRITHSGTHVTFANANNMRFFFNAGGKIRVNLTRVANGGSSATSKDDSVDEMITAMGDFDIASVLQQDQEQERH